MGHALHRRPVARRAATLALLLLVATAVPAAAAPTRGVHDPGFGGRDGIAAVDLGGHEEPFGVWARPDGSFVVGVTRRPRGTGTTRVAVLGFRADGRRDRAFGRDGVLDLGRGEAWPTQHLVTIDARGRLVAADDAGAVGRLRLRRWTREGRPDPAFGTRGVVSLTSPHQPVGIATHGRGGTVTVLAVTGGGAGIGWYGAAGAVWSLLRFTGAGAVDDTFGVAGVAPWSVGAFPGGGVLSAELRVDGRGRAVLAGTAMLPDLSRAVVVSRLGADGLPDRSYGTEGTALPDLGDATLEDVEVNGGRVTLLATRYGAGVRDPFDSGWAWVVARLDGSGVLDPTFSHDGRVERGLGVHDPFPLDLAVDAARRTYVTTMRSTWAEDGRGLCGPELCRRAEVVAIDAAGAFDVGFGTRGRAVVPTNDGWLAATRGGLLVAGRLPRTTWDAGVVRLT